MAIHNIKQNDYKSASKSRKRSVRNAFKKILKKRRIEARGNPTEAELKAKKIFIKNEIAFEFQKIFRQYRVDFYLRKTRTVIEIDGCYHKLDNQKIKDKWRREELMKHGKIDYIIRFTNEDVLHRPDYFISKVIEHIKTASDYHPATNDCCIGSSDDLNSLEAGACANESVVGS